MGENCSWYVSLGVCDTCFPGSAHVSTYNGEVSISNLRRGDRLLSPVLETSELETASHMADAHDPDPKHETQVAEFLEITHELMPPGRPLMITKDHFIYKASKGETDTPVMVPAADVGTGDYIFAMPLVGNFDMAKLEPSLVTK